MTILILSLVIAGIGTTGFLWIKGLYKTLSDQKIIIKSLRDQIVKMVELQGDKNDVVKKVKKGKKNINNATDDELSIAYAGKLRDVPTRKK